MLKNSKGPLPRMHCLRAFEAAGRHASFSRAAEELGAHQPAVSRYIAELEHEIGLQLFERHHRSVSLTPVGEVYHYGVTKGLERIAAAALTASRIVEDERVVITCSHAFSHQVLKPRFKALRRALDANVSLRIRTVDYGILQRLDEYESDLTITYNEDIGRPEHRVMLFSEAFTPVCSPEFAATHADVLAEPVTEWGALPFLRLAENHDWATFHDWFEIYGYPSPRPRFIGIEDYVYLIEAAIDGQGVALGWRFYIDHYVNDGLLVSLGDGFVERNRHCFARLTNRGYQRKIAHQCLENLRQPEEQ